MGFAPPVCGRFFADDGVFNRALPGDAPLDANSAAVTGALFRQVQDEIAAGRGPWINTTRFSVPIYTVGAHQPRVPVALGAGADPALAQALSDVPIPPDARPSPDSDGTLAVWQPSTDTLWEFWRLWRDRSGHWEAAWGGRIDRASTSPGYFGPPHAAWGASASGLSVVGGLITVPELLRGHIDHALAMALPAIRANAFALPAQRTDGQANGDDQVPEGAHFPPWTSTSSTFRPSLASSPRPPSATAWWSATGRAPSCSSPSSRRFRGAIRIRRCSGAALRTCCASSPGTGCSSSTWTCGRGPGSP